MLDEQDLRRALITYRENEMYPSGASISERKHGMLRRRMIDHLVAWKPTSTVEWVRELPDNLAQETDFDELLRHGPKIANIVRRHVQSSTPLRVISNSRCA